jgi:S-methylmethionine-dependent homocysteine/selenocysteine methylase
MWKVIWWNQQTLRLLCPHLSKEYVIPVYFGHTCAFHTCCRRPKIMALASPCLQDYSHVLKILCRMLCCSLTHSTVCIQTLSVATFRMAGSCLYPTWLSREDVHWFNAAFTASTTNRIFLSKCIEMRIATLLGLVMS